jgi:hypothetical protein
VSGPFAPTGRICAASTSARPPPLISFNPVIAQRALSLVATGSRALRLAFALKPAKLGHRWEVKSAG